MSEFKPIYILKILHIIHHQLSVGDLIETGLDYSQIVELISVVTQKGFVEDSGESGLKVTQSGLDLLEQLNGEIYSSNTKSWILPLDEFRVPKIDKLDIYLPIRKKHGD